MCSALLSCDGAQSGLGLAQWPSCRLRRLTGAAGLLALQPLHATVRESLAKEWLGAWAPVVERHHVSMGRPASAPSPYEMGRRCLAAWSPGLMRPGFEEQPMQWCSCRL